MMFYQNNPKTNKNRIEKQTNNNDSGYNFKDNFVSLLKQIWCGLKIIAQLFPDHPQNIKNAELFPFN